MAQHYVNCGDGVRPILVLGTPPYAASALAPSLLSQEGIHVEIVADQRAFDKRGLKILVISLLGFIASLLVCLYAMKFTNVRCELTYIDPTGLKDIIRTHWLSEEPYMSRDSSLLIRIAAHLEYDFDFKQDQIILYTNSTIKNNNITQSNAGQDSSKLITINSNNLDPIFGAGNNEDASDAYGGDDDDDDDNDDATEDNGDDDRRFLVLDFDHLYTIRTSADSQRLMLKLTSNCSIMDMSLVRNRTDIYVDKIKLELRKPSKRRKTCQVELPPDGAFRVRVNSNNSHLVHYLCDKAQLLRFDCYHYQTIYDRDDYRLKLGIRKILLARLQLHLLEYETKINVAITNNNYKSDDDAQNNNKSANTSNTIDDLMQDYELNFESPPFNCIAAELVDNKRRNNDKLEDRI